MPNMPDLRRLKYDVVGMRSLYFYWLIIQIVMIFPNCSIQKEACGSTPAAWVIRHDEIFQIDMLIRPVKAG